MRRLVATRLVTGIIVLFGVSVITFTFAALAPGDPFSAYTRGANINPGDLEALRQRLGLDAPIHVRYLAWLSQLMSGRLGTTVQGIDVLSLVASRLPATLRLMAVALSFSLALGVALGLYSALKRGGRVDTVVSTLVFLGISIPVYLVALVAIYVLAVEVRNWTGFAIFPTGGIRDPNSGLPPFVDELWHLALPALVLSGTLTAYFLRYTRASVIEAAGMDHVRTAHAKGLTDDIVRRRHILRNALLPLVTIIALQLPLLVAGAVFVETIFRYPGVGLLMVEATRNREYAVVMAITLLTATAIILSNLLADVLYGVIDPRIRRG